MGNMTRRKFIHGTTAIAAGAAVGLTAFKSIRTYAPMEIRTFFLSDDPLVIQGALYADDRRDVFGIRTFDKGREAVRAELRLSIVRETVAFPSRMARCHVTTWDQKGRIQEGDVSLVAKDGNLTFLVDERGRSPHPIWMSLTDARRVL
jgi:hypothetical protein